MLVIPELLWRSRKKTGKNHDVYSSTAKTQGRLPQQGRRKALVLRVVL